MKDYAETMVAYSVVPEGETEAVIKSIPEKRFNEMVEEAKKAGTVPPEPLKVQTFTFHEVESVDEIAALFGEDAVNVANRGGVLKQQTFVRGLMTDEEWEPVEGAYDLAEACARLTERVKATPVEKAAKALSKLSAEDIAALLARFQGAEASASA